jgi:hypothetical protein
MSLADPLRINHVNKSSRRRKKPTPTRQEFILETQNDRCFYCGLKLNDWYHDGKFARKREIHWDHVSPWVHSRNNNNDNFVASCNTCNGIKHDHVFETVEEAAEYIREKRLKKKLEIHPVWGNKATQKILASKLFANSINDVLNNPASPDDSEEVIQAKLENIRTAQRLLRKM